MREVNTRWPRRLALTGIYTLGLLGILASGGGGGGGSSDDTPDTTAPTVSSGVQVNAARNKVIAIFSEPMNIATLNTATFTLEDNGGNPVTGTVTFSGVTATFTPDVQLASNSTYTVTITTGARDLAGNPIAFEVSWSFTTASGMIQITWDANLETAVNRIGGGYRIYYSSISGFAPGDPGVSEIDVPYVSGALAPTSTVVAFDPGLYYLRIAGYSTLNNSANASPQITLDAP